jgi:hypothetical protein
MSNAASIVGRLTRFLRMALSVTRFSSHDTSGQPASSARSAVTVSLLALNSVLNSGVQQRGEGFPCSDTQVFRDAATKTFEPVSSGRIGSDRKPSSQESASRGTRLPPLFPTLEPLLPRSRLRQRKAARATLLRFPKLAAIVDDDLAKRPELEEAE